MTHGASQKEWGRARALPAPRWGGVVWERWARTRLVEGLFLFSPPFFFLPPFPSPLLLVISLSPSPSVSLFFFFNNNNDG